MTYNDGSSLQTLQKKKSQNKTGVSLYYFPARRFHPSVQVATNDKSTCFFPIARFLTAFLLLFVLFCSGKDSALVIAGWKLLHVLLLAIH